MDDLSDRIYDACDRHFDEIVAIRRRIHRNPEVGFEVHATAALAAEELGKLGIAVTPGTGGTGVVGDLSIPGTTKRIALRADMDALPIQEETGAPYTSRIEGRAHACGHDVHTAMLIGAARVIRECEDALTSNIRFIFQPSEEQLPGGAIGMIRDHVLDGVDEIYGMHVWPTLQTGSFGLCPGAFMAQSDSFTIEILGRGGHGAMPHFATDPILIGSHFVTMLQSLISRKIDPLEPATVSVTQFHGGASFNVIPPSVTISGTVRTLNEPLRNFIREQMQSMLAGITSAHGADYTFLYTDGYPVTFNHETCTEKARETALRLVRPPQVIFPHPPVLGGEDFSYYSEVVPACFMFLGAARHAETGRGPVCHDPRFDVDERCIRYGMAMHAGLALEIYREGKQCDG